MAVSEIQVRTPAENADTDDDRAEALSWLREQLDWEARLANLRAAGAEPRR